MTDARFPGSPRDPNMPSPDVLLHLAFAFAPPLMVRSAVDLGFFDALEAGPLTAEALAQTAGASMRGVTALCAALQAFGLLARTREGRIGLTPVSSTYLVKSRPEQNLGALFVQAGSQLIPSWLHLTECVRSGDPHVRVDQPTTGSQVFAKLVEGLLPMNWAAACDLADHVMREWPAALTLRVLDVAAGSAVWSLPLALRSSQVLVTAVDWPDVLEVTRDVCTRYDVASQYSFSAGDLRDAQLGQDHDLALLGHILHSEGERQARRILARVHEALAPGGSVVIAEFLVDDDRSGPLPALVFAVNMVVHSREGSTFSFGEISEWLHSVGFTDVRRVNVMAASPLIMASKPA